ncbi:MAG: redoxin family protein [Kiritimatiellaeota bacterium]|nr:redoxin family protein [Kiritimatiellota bacterium]
MKSVRCLSAVLSILLLAGFAVATEPAKPVDVGPPIEAPASLDEAMVTFTISDLPGFLDETGTVVSQIAPMMGGPMLKTMLGSKLGDPELTGFAPGKGLAVVMLNPSNVFAVAEVESTQVVSYVQSVQSMGLVAKQQDGLLLIANDEAQLVAAGLLAVKVQADLLEAKRDPSLRISLKPSALIAENEKRITEGLQQMLVKMEQAAVSNDVMNTQQILKAELQVFLSLGRQVESVETTLKPVAGGIHLSKILQPVGGSRFAAYCNAPALNDYNPLVQSEMLPDGVIEMEFCMRNPDALVEFFSGEAANLSEVMDLDPAMVAQWTEYMTRWMKAMGSTVCESVFTEGGNPVGFTILEDVKDEASLMEALRNISADLEKAGCFKLYQSMGMPMSVDFKENTRKVADVNVHQLKMDFEMENIPPEQAEAMKAMMGDMSFDLAIYKDVLIYTSGEGAVEKVIEKLNSGGAPVSQLAARAAFPSGGMYYADFDMGGYFGLISSFMGEVPEASAMFEKFTAVMKGAEPVVMSGYLNSGRMKFCSQLPADLLVRFAQAGQLIAMENMQKKSAMEAEQKAQQPTGPAPEGTLKLLDGTAVQISSHVGQQVVVLDFWAGWCGPCRKGLPMVQAVADHFAGSDVVFYAVNLREDAETVQGFFKDAGLSLPVALDDGALSEAFGVSGIPHTVIIGKDGMIKATHTGFAADLDAQLTSEINAALAE